MTSDTEEAPAEGNDSEPAQPSNESNVQSLTDFFDDMERASFERMLAKRDVGETRSRRLRALKG